MSRVIRGAGPPTRVVPSEIVDARTEAARIVADARAEAERTRESARADAASVRARARDEGLAEARAESAATLLAAARIRDGSIAGAETELQSLALAAAERIVAGSIALEPERIVAIVRGVLTRARRARGLEVRVHPDDVEALSRADLAAGGEGAGVRVLGDPTVTRGGCVVKSELGVIDARVEVQLDAMAKLLGCERT